MLYVTDPDVQFSIWDLLQQAVAFALALASLVAIVGGAAYKFLGPRWRARRARERAQRQAEILVVVSDAVKPLQEKVDAIHHTTHVNSGVSPVPTMKDDLHLVKHLLANIDDSIQRVSYRFDNHLRDDHGREPDDN